MKDDTISRQAALYSYQKEVCDKVKCYECKATDEDGTCKLERWIKELPSAERHGRWLKGDEMADYPRVPYKPWETYCSCCGEIKEQSNDGFCGNCGARMEESE